MKIYLKYFAHIISAGILFPILEQLYLHFGLNCPHISAYGVLLCCGDAISYSKGRTATPSGSAYATQWTHQELTSVNHLPKPHHSQDEGNVNMYINQKLQFIASKTHQILVDLLIHMLNASFFSFLFLFIPDTQVPTA